MMRAREGLMMPIRDMLSNIGLTEQQWRILRVLEEFGPMDATQLAEKACLLLPSLSRILRGMEGKELVKREMDIEDRRRQSIVIAPAGRALLLQNSEQARALAKGVEERLGAEKLRTLLDLLAEVEDKFPRNG